MRLYAGTIRNIHTGTIYTYNPEYLPVSKTPCRDNQEQNAGTIYASNSEHLLLFMALCGAHLKQNAGKIQAFNLDHLLFWLNTLTIQNRMRDGPRVQSMLANEMLGN